MSAIVAERSSADASAGEMVPAVSVVIPTYNRGPELARLLDSLQRCELPPGGAEYIVVDDGSSDDTPAVLARSALVGLTSIRQDNGGAASARNRGWRMARGALIVFTDDDCVPTKNWLTDMVDGFASDDVAGIGGEVVPLVPGFLAEFVQAERLVGHGGDADNVKYLVTANAGYRRCVLDAVGGFDERFPGAAGEDTDLTLRVLEHDLQLKLIDSATVAHDHRTSIRGLLRTYHRHGRAWSILARSHPQRELGTRSTRMATARYWRERHQYYRDEGASSSAASIYCALRFAGLACYATGILRGEVEHRRSLRP
jgi:GT2 family glycosyltransferase